MTLVFSHCLFGRDGREKGKRRERDGLVCWGMCAPKSVSVANVRVLRVGGVGGGVGWVGPSVCFVRGLTFNDLQEHTCRRQRSFPSQSNKGDSCTNFVGHGRAARPFGRIASQLLTENTRRADAHTHARTTMTQRIARTRTSFSARVPGKGLVLFRFVSFFSPRQQGSKEKPCHGNVRIAFLSELLHRGYTHTQCC